jgi:hypothetical protein
MRSQSELRAVANLVASGTTATCSGIAWRQMNAKNISVARRDAVAKLDVFIGPKG